LLPDAEINHNTLPLNTASPNHILIEGDNLHALTALTFTHEGKIDVIYIDPPYNTGNKDFKYNDSFVDKEDSYRHSKWLSFMHKRLEIAKRLLSDKGVIFISIDDNENAQIKILCDEIFGELNFTGQIIVETATDNNPSQISVEHEYLLCYSKDLTLQGKWIGVSEGAILIQNEYNRLHKQYLTNVEIIQKELRKWIKQNKEHLNRVAHYSYVDDFGVYYPDNPSNTKLGGYEFEVLHPISNKPCSLPTNGFRFPEYTFNDMLKNGNMNLEKMNLLSLSQKEDYQCKRAFTKCVL
jgi:adenine-specific DNA-methyltransferase